MKKIIIFCLAFTMLLCMSVSLLAENGGFIESPSNNQAPLLVNGINTSEDCSAQVIITAFLDRHTLSEESLKMIEEACAQINANPDLSKLQEKLIDLAEEYGVDVTDFAVSDIFDISSTDCDGHVDHGHFDIVLKAETLENFVCLLHYYNDEWTIVEGAEVTNNGEHLEFDADEFSPFAIVVNTGAPASNDDTGNTDGNTDNNVNGNTDNTDSNADNNTDGNAESTNANNDSTDGNGDGNNGDNKDAAIYAIIIAIIALILLIIVVKKNKKKPTA